MANVLSGNTYYIDTASSGGTNFLESKSVQVVGIIFFGHSSSHTIKIHELSGQATEGSAKLIVSSSAAHQTVYLDFVDAPIRFTNGVWINSINANSTCTLILKFN